MPGVRAAHRRKRLRDFLRGLFARSVTRVERKTHQAQVFCRKRRGQRKRCVFFLRAQQRAERAERREGCGKENTSAKLLRMLENVRGTVERNQTDAPRLFAAIPERGIRFIKTACRKAKASQQTVFLLPFTQ